MVRLLGIPYVFMRIHYALGWVIVSAATFAVSASEPVPPVETQRLMLSGHDHESAVPWEFKVSGGRRSGEWTTIPVPSNWEMQGFGSYHYHRDWGSEHEAPDKTGWYRHRFTVPAAWRDRTIELVFGGVMTDAAVTLNGASLGPIHQGGFYEFRFDVTGRVALGAENLLEVAVDRYSANESVNNAERRSDYWLFSGIYRPVWLEARPPAGVEHVAVDARHDGTFVAHVRVAPAATRRWLRARLRAFEGAALGPVVVEGEVDAGAQGAVMRGRFDGIKPWSAEYPHLYDVDFELGGAGASSPLVHTVRKTIGFRTVEVRPGEAFLVNGKPVRLRGVNRHSFWPTTGRTTSALQSEEDVRLMKEMNMNAVRMSHYPPDAHFLAAADRLGLYVIDELAGWQRAYDSEVGRTLVREMITRDVNHPSIVLWSNGNEGGWNASLDADFARHDPQRRVVIHPWANANGINTSHYEVYGCCTDWFFGGSDLILPTEFLHALYDGGGAAGLDDWWKLMLSHPLAIGGFLWAFADEGIVRDDQGGQIDVCGNSAPDGVVGPFRQKEGSFHAIREIWSPVYLPISELDRLPGSFTGTLRVENRYDFTNLKDVTFSWALRRFARPGASAAGAMESREGNCASPDVPPRTVGELDLALPADWRTHDSLVLRAVDPHGQEIYAWTWMLHSPADILVSSPVPEPATEVRVSEDDESVTLHAGSVAVKIERATGQLVSLSRDGRQFSLKHGPRIVSGEAKLDTLRHFAAGTSHVVNSAYTGHLRNVRWELEPGGRLRLDYTYAFPSHAETDYLGVTFDFDESDAHRLRWLGKGPFRVWKNRLKGVEFGVWEKSFNDTATGQDWVYPEFKGFHDDLYWAELTGDAGVLTIATGNEDLFLRVLTPAEGEKPRTSHVAFPPGGLSLLQGITPIGTKFHPAADHGPQGGPNLVRRHGLNQSVTVYFQVAP